MVDKILPDEVATFLKTYPDTEVIDLLIPDMNGVLRGKQIPIHALNSVFEIGLPFAGASNLMNIKGEVADTIIQGGQDGDPDVLAQPVPGTLAPVPWALRSTGQLLMSMFDLDGTPYVADTRNILAKALKPVQDMKLTPVIAVELEFYLVDADTLPPQPAKPPVRYPELSGAQCYNLDTLYDFEQFLSELSDVCKAQNIPASSALGEYGPGQFEVNLEHGDDVIRACEQGILLKRAAKGVARKHGLLSTFMAKPFADQDGNGLHIHLSLYDEERRNIFAGDNADDPYSDTLRHAVGGLLQTIPDAMAIFAPNANSYRRFRPGTYVPLTANWGPNHRGVAVRLPVSEPVDTRLEHRIAGADANPYLVVAAILAGIHSGLTNKCDPGPMVQQGTLLGDDLPITLPVRWEAALDAFENSKILPEYLGEEYTELFAACRRSEAELFHFEISDRDYDWYLRTT